MERLQGTVLRIAGNAVEVAAGNDVYRCTLRGRLKHVRMPADKIAAPGDRVEFTPVSSREGEIERVLPRRTKLSRHDVLDPAREQVIAANIDQVVACQAAADPPPDPLQIDRSMVMAASGGMKFSICLSKVDLTPEKDWTDLFRPYLALGIPIFFVSALRGDGIERLYGHLQGRSSILLGPSGVGKSTLLNVLNPDLKLRTREVSRKTGEGRHTTSRAELLPIGAGMVVDTPGIEFFTLWGVDETNLAGFFPEFKGRRCRYENCTHRVEPGCGVLNARDIAASRLASYAAMFDELKARPKKYRREGRRRIRQRYLEKEEGG